MLLTTGVDAQTCKLIVIDSVINSMTKFKQMIGRGTRIREDYGKYYFTIMDFRGATRLFADPKFDGEPVVIYEPDTGDPVTPPDAEGDELPPDIDGGDIVVDPPGGTYGGDDGPGRVKYYVDNVEVKVINEIVQYYDTDGKLVTESLIDYTKKNLKKEYADLDEFIKRWNEEDRKTAIIEELKEHGVFLEEVREEVDKNLDDFDLILHLAFDKKPLTRKERADNVVKRNYFSKYSDVAKQVLEALLDKYKNEGIKEIENIEVLTLDPFNKIAPVTKIVKEFGGREKYLESVKELEKELYA
jgi:type I restriction enzyme R subunit